MNESQYKVPIKMAVLGQGCVGLWGGGWRTQTETIGGWSCLVIEDQNEKATFSDPEEASVRQLSGRTFIFSWDQK